MEGVAALDRRAPAAGAPGHRGRRRRVPAGAPRDRRRAGDDSHCLRCHLSGLLDPTTDNLCRDVLRRIGREGRNRCRGQVTGVGWAQAEAAAARAADSGNLQGFRDAAIILVMSDTLARISEVVALQCSDVEPETTTSGGTVHITGRARPTSSGAGATRYIGPATLDAITPPARCFAGCCAVATAVANRSARTASGGSFASGLRPCPAAAGESAGTRSGWAELQQAGRVALALIRRRSTFASRPPAVRSRAAPLPGGPVATLSTGQVYLRSAAAKCQPACTARPYLDEQAYSLLRMTGEQTGTYVQATR